MPFISPFYVLINPAGCLVENTLNQGESGARVRWERWCLRRGGSRKEVTEWSGVFPYFFFVLWAILWCVLLFQPTTEPVLTFLKSLLSSSAWRKQTPDRRLEKPRLYMSHFCKNRSCKPGRTEGLFLRGKEKCLSLGLGNAATLSSQLNIHKQGVGGGVGGRAA